MNILIYLKEIKLTYARSGEIYPDPLSLDVVLRDIHHFPNRKNGFYDFKTQKSLYRISRLVRVYVGLI
jgi:hypothetical protein